MLRTVAGLLVVTLLLAGCSKPLPNSKQNYAGDWRSKEMSLLILADGTVSYRRSRNGATTSVNGPIKEFDNGGFVVGVLFLTTTFEVTEAPHHADGKWQMVVDGVRLTRVE